MKELGRVLEGLNGQKTGKAIEDAFNAYQIEGYSGNEEDCITVLGVKRIGRELVRTSVHRGDMHMHHYIYFYDWVDPREPETRWGIETDRENVRLYSVPVGRHREDASYVPNPSPERIDYFLHFLQQMPTGPGDIRLAVKLQ